MARRIFTADEVTAFIQESEDDDNVLDSVLAKIGNIVGQPNEIDNAKILYDVNLNNHQELWENEHDNGFQELLENNHKSVGEFNGTYNNNGNILSDVSINNIQELENGYDSSEYEYDTAEDETCQNNMFNDKEVDFDPSSKKRKRKREDVSWKQNIAIKYRASGKEYIGKKI